MKFTGECEGQSVSLDAKPPFGKSDGLTPKELVAIAAAGCTGMDVVGLMKKFRQAFESLEIKADVSMVEGVQPPVFKEVVLTYLFAGQIDREKTLEAVRLSQTKYCSVSAMLSKPVPIHYVVLLNGEEIGTGESRF